MDPNKEQPNGGVPQPLTEHAPAQSTGAPQPAGTAPGGSVGPTAPEAPTPLSPMGSGVEPPKNNKKMLMILAGVIAAIIVIALASYFLFMNKDDRSAASSAAKNSTADTGGTALETLNNLTMNNPQELRGYTDSGVSLATAKQFIAKDESCVLQFGTLSEEQLPGTDLADIVAKQVQAVRDAGGTVEGPDSGGALVLKDADDGSTAYNLPTLVFSYSKDANRVKQYYSAAVLKNGDRAFVSRICGNNQSKDVPDDNLKEVNHIATGITISKKE